MIFNNLFINVTVQDRNSIDRSPVPLCMKRKIPSFYHRMYSTWGTLGTRHILGTSPMVYENDSSCITAVNSSHINLTLARSGQFPTQLSVRSPLKTPSRRFNGPRMTPSAYHISVVSFTSHTQHSVQFRWKLVIVASLPFRESGNVKLHAPDCGWLRLWKSR